MNTFFLFAARIAALCSSFALASMAIKSIEYDHNTLVVSVIGIGLWIWSEFDNVSGKNPDKN